MENIVPSTAAGVTFLENNAFGNTAVDEGLRKGYENEIAELNMKSKHRYFSCRKYLKLLSGLRETISPKIMNMIRSPRLTVHYSY